jgi:hypothetical protein
MASVLAALAGEEAGRQWPWLLIGLAVAFLVPFLLADRLRVPRDLFYALYGVSVIGLFAGWIAATDVPLGPLVARNWEWGLPLAGIVGVVMFLVPFREQATRHPTGMRLAEMIAWRGIAYGAADGLLLSVYPILVVFATFGDTGLRDTLAGNVAVGAIALVGSLVFTAVYHLGYRDFRSRKVVKPVAGDLIWSIPTLVSLNPFGAPIAHAAMHVSAVVHCYETDVFLPPHRGPELLGTRK